MNYEQAKKLRDDNLKLIGTTVNDSIIEHIVICPTNDEQREMFFKSFLRNNFNQDAIEPFLKEDMQVIVLYDTLQIEDGYLKFANLLLLPVEIGVAGR